MVILKDSQTNEGIWRILALLVLFAALVCLPAGPAGAQEEDQPAQEEQQPEGDKKTETEEEEVGPAVKEEVTVTGTRAEGRTATETLAPVDFINTDMLQSSGATETGKALQLLAPSFNFSTTYISDGTDIIRPATLRSLGANHVLVLVNGKRRHQTAHLNVQQTIARGESGTDINAIPISAIDHIEVLRDGAAAQYGSDAIAGVINIILKDGFEGEVNFQTGVTYEGDGENVAVSANKGFKIGEKGVINITGEYRDRGETNRAGLDVARVSPPRVTQRIGDPDAKDGLIWGNLALPTGNGEFYAFGGWSERKGNSSGFFRSAGDGRTVPDIYPNGFLPTIITKPTDASIVAGYRGAFNPDWKYDASINYGHSEFKFREENTVNVSWFYEPIDPSNPNSPIFAESPLEADTGTLKLNMTSATFDVAGTIDWGKGVAPLFVAFGGEVRRDAYQIVAGDPVSYTYGRTNDFSIDIRNQNGDAAAIGTQGFPGWSPTEEVDDSRTNSAIWVDTEAQLTEKLRLGGAARFEHYSDFGNTLIGKFSARYEVTEEFSVRSTVSNGFRAPGIQQIFFSQRSTNLNNAGVLTDTLTARPGSDVARALGVSELNEETSINFSAGFVAKPTHRFRFTVDYFQINIDDRIIFSSNLQPETDPDGNPVPGPVRTLLEPFGLGQLLLFTNAVDTRTRGVDVVALYDIDTGGDSHFLVEGAFNFNKTEVTARRSPSTILPAPVLFDQAQVTLVEEGQPRQHHAISGTYYRGPWTGNVRFNYFGEVAGQGFSPRFEWGGKWLTDASVGYRFGDNITVSFGGLNIFDVYPDEWDPAVSGDFALLGFIYGWETLPFGINGGSYYARANYRF